MINSKRAGIMESKLVQIILISAAALVIVGIYLVVTGRINSNLIYALSFF